MARVELRVDQDPAHVRLVRLVAAAVGRMAGLDEETLHEVRLGVTEACGLAMDSLAAAESPDPVSLWFDDVDGLRVAVKAAADVLDPAITSLAGNETRSTDFTSSGTPPGSPIAVDRVALIEGLVDEVDIARSATGAVITMRWKRDQG
ncbi:MAG: ATP-binding protein [Nocardioidaceae bacterium]